MKYAVLRLTNFKKYWLDASNDDELVVLANFLTYDVGTNASDILSFKSWIFDTRYSSTSSNVSFLEKKSNKIIIEDLFLSEEDKILFSIDRTNLISVLEKWEQLCKKKTAYIAIKRNEEKITLEECNRPGLTHSDVF